jgi:glycosyltransferase involved in cell wall biosynthesis
METSQPLKVLLVTGNLQVKGSVIYTLNLALGLKKFGVSLCVAHGGGKMLPEFISRGIATKYVEALGKRVYNLLSFRKDLKELAAGGFSIVHIQSPEVAKQGVRISRHAGIPALLTVHHLVTRAKALRISRRSIKSIIAVSQAVREDLVNIAKIPRELITVIPASVDIELAQRCASMSLKNEVPVIGTIGMLSRVKGNEPFLRAVREVLDRNYRAHFVVAGEGEQEAHLRILAKRLNLARDLTFVNAYTNDMEVIATLDIFVSPSMEEGLGLTVLEAMACAKPVISTAVGGVTSFIEDGKNGLLVNPGSSSALRDAIIRLIENTQLRQEIARNGAELVCHNYSLESTAASTLELYSRVAAEWCEGYAKGTV